MTATFVDTSHWIAVLRTTDQHHERAMAWQHSLQGALITTEYVLLEFGNACSTGALRQRFAATFPLLIRDRALTVVPVSMSLLKEGFDLFVSRMDKNWSLTDCTSFVVMRRHGLVNALTADRHFEQSGFRALLRTDPDSAERD